MKLHLFLLMGGLALPAARADWPQWLGPARDGRVTAGALNLRELPESAEPLWRRDIGGGFSSPVTAGGVVVYCDLQGDQEVAHAVDAATGKELWATPYAPGFGDEWGPGPRATPLIDGDRVYVQSCSGEFRCLGLKDGKIRWGVSFEKDFGVTFVGNKANEGTASRRGNNGSAVIDGDRVFVPVGARNGASVVAFDKLTGRQVWKSGDDEAAYAGLRVADIAGVRQVVAFTADALCGFAREDGAPLWRVPLRTGAKRHAATPVIDGDRVFVNSHTLGTLCFRVVRDGARWRTEEVWANRQAKVNLASFVLHDGHLYGHGPSRNLICLDAATGRQLWAQAGFGREYSSTVVLDGGRLLVLADHGELVLVAAEPAAYRELGRLQATGKTWSMPAAAQGRLILREGLTDGWKLSAWSFAR